MIHIDSILIIGLLAKFACGIPIAFDMMIGVRHRCHSIWRCSNGSSGIYYECILSVCGPNPASVLGLAIAPLYFLHVENTAIDSVDFRHDEMHIFYS
jgi:hypothetical protein